MTWVWPIDALKPRSATPHLAERTLSGAASLTGQTQVSATDAGIWTCSYEGFPVVTRNRVIMWRALQAYLEGRLNVIDVPLYDYEVDFSPVATDLDWKALLTSVPHSDGAYFSDGSGYAIDEITDITTTASAALRATSVTVSVTYGPELQPGMIFELNHATKGPRWYMVKSYNSTTGALTFRPPLREAISSGDQLRFTNPKCRMRLSSDDAMLLKLDAPGHGFPNVSFVEAL